MTESPFFAAVLAATTLVHDPAVRLTPGQIESFNSRGTCESAGQSIDLDRVMILENRSIVVGEGDGSRRISVNGEDIFIDNIEDGEVFVREIIDVDYEVDPTDDLDIEIKLAYFDNRLSIYWKETFQNRVYRQGMFYVGGAGLTLICTGRGGRHVQR